MFIRIKWENESYSYISLLLAYLLFSLLVCMTEFTKAADRGVLERVIYLAKSKGTVYTLLGKVSEQSGFLLFMTARWWTMIVR